MATDASVSRLFSGIKSRSDLIRLIRKYCSIQNLKNLIFNPEYLPVVGILILLTELILSIVVIQRVPYTEIDWIAYMQECEGFLNGTTNYDLLRGDTGPLVYPAGFVYIYSALYFITSYGRNIRLAQYIFLIIYLLQLYLVIRLYTKSRKVPPYVLVLSIFTSYRIHSIYILRLFNDPIAILFLYLAINLFLDEKWILGSMCFSLGVSVKMNILLFAPAVLLFYISNLGYVKTIYQLAICAIIQLLIGAPFLLSYPVPYLKASFNLGRVFDHKWTVNYRFLDQATFESRIFHLFLICTHLFILALLASPAFTFFKNYCRLRELQKQLEPQIERQNLAAKPEYHTNDSDNLTPDQKIFLKSFENSLAKASVQPISKKANMKPISTERYSIYFEKCTQLALLPLFLCNFIGIIFARSLHYQFYVWYFHSLPYLSWCTNYNLVIRLLILGLIELCWNTYPSTILSSITLHVCHIVLLIGVSRSLFKTTSLSDDINKSVKSRTS